MLISFEFQSGESFAVESAGIPLAGDLINLKYVGLNCFGGDRRLYAVYEKSYDGKKMSVARVEWFPNTEANLPVVKIHLMQIE